MRNVYFVQVDVSASLGAQNAYLPYTAGILAANAWTSDIVKSNFLFKEFIFLREDIAGVVARMDAPAVVAFSNYCWNTEYNKTLAAAVKEKYPDCITVFGGHNVPNDFSFLEKYPYIDILCHGEGEDTVKKLFEALAVGADLVDVPNISYRGADANFGMFSRDLEIADVLVKAKETTGYPERMRMNYAKNNYENVFAIVKKFKECEFDRIGATLSFQSLSPQVLKNIGRTNSDLEFYKNLLVKYKKENMRTYSELILGLPGETYESFAKGIATLFDIGQHFVFEVYGCILLPNSVMGQKEYMEKFGIKTVRSEIIRPHFQNEAFSIPEYNDIVVQTNTMPREMWVRSHAFFYMAKALHGNGLLRAFAIYLHNEMDVPYDRFYDGILNYYEENPSLFTAGLYREIKERAAELSLGTDNRKLQFEPCGDIIWDDHEFFVLNALYRMDDFYDEMLPYLRRFGIPDDVFADLLRYQKSIMRTPLSETSTAALRYDVHGYLSDAYLNILHPLVPKAHTLVMRDSDPKTDWPSFGKHVIWYGRMGWASYKDDVTYSE